MDPDEPTRLDDLLDAGEGRPTRSRRPSAVLMVSVSAIGVVAAPVVLARLFYTFWPDPWDALGYLARALAMFAGHA